MKSDLIDIQVESRGNDVELTLSGSLGLPKNAGTSGSVAGVELTGSYHMTASIPISKTINGTAVTVELSEAASCQVGW